MIVVDTNVLAYLCLPSEFTAKAEALLECDPLWVARVQRRSEFRNILAGYLRRGSLTFDQALALPHEAHSLLSDNEYEVELRAVLQLVRDGDCLAYDCEFVALATQLGVPLVTMDGKLLKAFPQHAKALATA